MKKGFTLIEAVGVIILLGLIALVTIPIVEKQLSDGKEKLYNNQIKTIELAAQNWMSDNIKYKPNNSESITIMLSHLKKENYIAFDLTNPMNKKYFANDMLIKISNNEGIIEYKILTDTGTDYSLYDQFKPVITLNGDPIIYLELGTAYIELGTVEDTTISGSVDTSKEGIYPITYLLNKDAATAFIRNVIVRDTKAPIITILNDSVIIYDNEIGSTNFLNNITVTDNSNYDIITVSDISIVPGTYTLTFKAKDNSGNESSKNIKVEVRKSGNPIIMMTSKSVTINKGEQYDLMLGVSAIDANGFALNNITCTVNGTTCNSTTTLNTGIHIVTYKATDSKGKISNATKSLKVN